MNLRELVERYRKLGNGFGRAVALSEFGTPREETERTFSALDEDYHISRFFHFTLDPACEGLPERTYQINDVPQSHVAMDEAVLEIL